MSLLGREFRTLSSEDDPDADPRAPTPVTGDVVAFYGVRDLVAADDPELGAYADGSHPACGAARRVGLELRVLPTGDGAAALWLGRALGELAAADGTDGHVAVDPEELARAMAAVAGGLGVLGRADAPALHLQRRVN